MCGHQSIRVIVAPEKLAPLFCGGAKTKG